MNRLFPSAVSFAVVFAAYWIYVLLAVPLIEPTISDASAASGEGSFTEPSVDRRMRQLKGLFHEGAWELQKPIIFENDKVMLLLKKLNNLGGGRVELKDGCTMVFLWDGPADDEEQRRRQSVVLEAPQGAILKFDKPIDLRSLKIGRLVGGYLLGPIKIRSQGKSPGPEDDLLILTRDVQLSEKEIWTPKPVEFTWGKNSGRGHDMHIMLLSDPSKSAKDLNTPNIAGVESFEMRHLEALHLETSAAAKADQGDGAKKRFGGLGFDAGGGAVDISCRGPFYFNVVRREASFTDQVDVTRLNPNGRCDQIQCEQLLIHFASRENGKPIADNSPELSPEWLEARGRPVVINAPSQNLTGRGERLNYNIKTNLIALDGGPEVYLRQGPNEIHGRSLQYQSLAPNQLGRAAAQGPGWIQAQSPENPQGKLLARWNDLLQLEPKGKNHVLSFTGGAIMDYSGVGRMEAKEIYFWLKQNSGASQGQPQFQPDRMLAQNHVTITSKPLCATVDQLEIWFENKGDRQQQNGQNPQLAQNTPTNSPGSNASPMGNWSDQSRNFKLSGGLLQALILLDDSGQSSVAEVTVEGHARIEETQTSEAAGQPILIQGDRLHGRDLSSPDAEVSVAGSPAHFEGRSLGLSGADINLNLGKNVLSINGPGRMDLLPMQNNMAGQSSLPDQTPLPPGNLLIQWKKGMHFDGQIATFEDEVSATMPQRHVQTQSLKIKLKRPLNFAQMRPEDQNQTEVEEMLCRGGVFLENRSCDAQQQPISYERLKVEDLAVNLQTGALTAGGPGWLNSVRYGANNPVESQFSPAITGRSPLQPTDHSGQEKFQLTGLHVRFQDAITGNLLANHLNLTFKDQIRAIYAPVPDWNSMLNPDDLERQSAEAMLLKCDNLTVAQTPMPVGKNQSIEVQCLGNAVVEGGIFTARAQRISYSEAKDLLILEGNGRSDAELYRQSQPGAAANKVQARKILFWPKSNRFIIEGARALEINPAPSGTK